MSVESEGGPADMLPEQLGEPLRILVKPLDGGPFQDDRVPQTGLEGRASHEVERLLRGPDLPLGAEPGRLRKARVERDDLKRLLEEPRAVRIVAGDAHGDAV